VPQVYQGKKNAHVTLNHRHIGSTCKKRGCSGGLADRQNFAWLLSTCGEVTKGEVKMARGLKFVQM